MFWLPDIAVSQVSSPPRKPPSGCRSNPVVSAKNLESGCNAHVGCECDFLEPYFVPFVVSILRSFRSSNHRKQGFHQNRRALSFQRDRGIQRAPHSEPFGRQRPGANRRSIKQFFTRSKQTAASNRNCSLVLSSLLPMSFVHRVAPWTAAIWQTIRGGTKIPCISRLSSYVYIRSAHARRI